MSSDLFLLDGSFFRHSSSDLVSSDLDLEFFSDPFFPCEDSPSDILQAISQDSKTHFPSDPSSSVTNSFSSPPSTELNNLSLDSTTQLQSLPISAISVDGFTDFSVLNTLGMKTEESYVGFDSYSNEPSLLQTNNQYGSEKFMQRSFSSQSLDRKPGFLFTPRFNLLLEAPIFQTQVLGSPENTECDGPMRRVCSTGDLQRIKTKESSHGLSSSPLASENTFMEEGSCKVRRYSAEERKQRIHRYRSKRAQRNFSKTIKYACRKTLADSRPRVRGRFARNDETGEIPKVTGFNREEEDEDEFWVDGFHHEEDGEAMLGGGSLNNSGPTQRRYYKF